MINEFKPLKYDISIYTSFYAKNLYKARKNAKLTDRQFSTLMQCYLLETYVNKLISAGSLRSLVPYNMRMIHVYITVLLERGYIQEVKAITPRPGAKNRNKFYTLTNEGIVKVEFMNRNIKLDIKAFEIGKKWNEPKPKTKEYYKQLGILNSGQSKKE